MRTDHQLTLTVEQAGKVLGVGRSTAYELVRSGELASIRLRRRIVIPVAHLAERLGVTTAEVRNVLDGSPARAAASEPVSARLRRSRANKQAVTTPTLF